MSDDGGPGVSGAGGARMSGGRDGDRRPGTRPIRCPTCSDTQAIPGLGSRPPAPAGIGRCRPGTDGRPGAGQTRPGAARRTARGGRPAATHDDLDGGGGRPDSRRGGARDRRRRKTGQDARTAPPQLLARAPGARRRRAGARARHQVLRDPGLLHPVRARCRTPSRSATGCSSTRSSTTCGRSTAATSSCSTAAGRGTSTLRRPSSNIFSKGRASSRASSASATTPPSTSSG